jgi:hypothetical protein
MSDERIRRPPLDRTTPIRNWSTLLGTSRPPAPAEPHAADPDAHPDPGAEAVPPSPHGAVSRSVELGYRVIDDYLERGQRAAERLRQGTYDAEAVSDDVRDLATRMVRYVSDFSAAWLEFLERASLDGPPAGDPPSEPSADIAPAPATAEPSVAPASAHPLHVRVSLVTDRRAEIALDLEPVPAGSRLVVHALRATTLDLPRITSVLFEPGTADTGTFRIAVPEGQPAGTYHGLVIDDAQNRPVGSLTLILYPAC